MVLGKWQDKTSQPFPSGCFHSSGEDARLANKGGEKCYKEKALPRFCYRALCVSGYKVFFSMGHGTERLKATGLKEPF